MEGSVTSVTFSPNSTHILWGSVSKGVQVYDAETGAELTMFQGHHDSVSSVAFSPDGTCIVSGISDNLVWVWDAATGEEPKMLKGHSEDVISLAFSHDGTCIVSGSYDKSLRMWNVATGEELKTMNGHSERVTSVAFSPDDTRIVLGSFNKSVRVWNITAGLQTTVSTCVATFLRICGNSTDNIPVVVDSTGWVFSDCAGSNRLMWISPHFHPLLYETHCILIIFDAGSVQVSFKDCVLGTNWAKCYLGKSNPQCH